jgi:hypothetical protein
VPSNIFVDAGSYHVLETIQILGYSREIRDKWKLLSNG